MDGRLPRHNQEQHSTWVFTQLPPTCIASSPGCKSIPIIHRRYSNPSTSAQSVAQTLTLASGALVFDIADEDESNNPAISSEESRRRIHADINWQQDWRNSD
jgi:hypothetical protein